MKMVNCPHCGKPLARDGRSKYYCENEGCPVVFVRRPYNPFGRKVAFTFSVTEETVKKTKEQTQQEILLIRQRALKAVPESIQTL
jgi:uncharacterized Zn finger protein (UPF0148 family)